MADLAVPDKRKIIVDKIIDFIDDYCPEFAYSFWKLKSKDIPKAKPFVYNIIKSLFDNVKYSDLETCTTSCGLVLIMIFNDYVVKLACKDSYDKMKLASDTLPISKYLCQTIGTCDEFKYIVEERLEPIVNNNVLNPIYDIDLIDSQIKKALTEFHDYDICHSDARLDNVGYRKSTNTYVLFDYNSTKKATYDAINDDYTMFNNSIMYHKKIEK